MSEALAIIGNWLHSVVLSAFWFVVVVGILVFLHESGHFLTAKLFGMRVDVFSLGFGRRLFGRRRGGTDYRVSMIPLGGYVKLTGGEEFESRPAELPPDYYLARPRWQRFLVLVMGPAVNIVLAVVLFAGAFMLGVEMAVPTPPVIEVVSDDSPAQVAGLRRGDRIVTANGAPMASWEDLVTKLLTAGEREVELGIDRAGKLETVRLTAQFDGTGMPRIGAQVRAPAVASSLVAGMPADRAGIKEGDLVVAIDGEEIVDRSQAVNIIHDAAGKSLVVTIERAGQRLDLPIKPELAPLPDGAMVGRIGLIFRIPTEVVKLAPVAALRRGFDTALEQAGVLFAVLKHLVTLKMPFSTLAGPLEIAKASKAFAAEGSRLLSWMAFISLQLGIINLLPIPVIDGGQIFILLTEGVLRRDIDDRVKAVLNQIGFVALLVLMICVVGQDIWRNI